jgi:hypothetical protein
MRHPATKNVNVNRNLMDIVTIIYHLARQRILPQPLANQRGRRVKTLAHLRRPQAQPNAHSGRQAQHARHSSFSSRPENVGPSSSAATHTTHPPEHDLDGPADRGDSRRRGRHHAGERRLRIGSDQTWVLRFKSWRRGEGGPLGLRGSPIAPRERPFPVVKQRMGDFVLAALVQHAQAAGGLTLQLSAPASFFLQITPVR